MATRGYFAYRYQGKYYRIYIGGDAYPSGYGRGVTRGIPRDAEGLNEYIEATTKKLLDKGQRRKLFFWEDHEIGTSSAWTLGDTFIEWTYVIDFDNRVFTVNGAVHFPFDNMPPLESSDSEMGFAGYLQSYERIEIPSQYLTTIDLWPAPRFDIAQAQQQYDELQPAVVTLPEWATHTWNSLSVCQYLATSIVRTLVQDYSDELALTHYPNVWHKIGLFCWQVANAAAPSHLICPPLDATPQHTVLYVRADLVRVPVAMVQSIHHHIGGKGTLGRYCWFRGCLITFCPRLDQPAYMMHQVGEMVQHLRGHERTDGVGIIMSGWHIISVAIDGTEVRHSPVLELHDGKELKDGMLLLMHLLSPAYTVSKKPWRAEPPIHHPNISSKLPDDIIRHIIHFTDLETHRSLQLVSRSVRLACLAHPRVGNCTLLSYKGHTKSGPSFRVRSTISTYSTIATLMRTKSSIDVPYPIWRFRAKHYSKCVLSPGLAGTFQYHQPGIGPLDEDGGRGSCDLAWGWASKGEENDSNPLPYLRQLPFRNIIKGNVYHDMRIQTVDGIWEMVVGNATPPIEIEDESHERSLYERMTGFESRELRDMSEVENFQYLSG